MTVLPTAITPATAQQRLVDDGLLALGLTVPLIGSVWSPLAVSFDPDTLTLTMPGPILAPLLAVRSWVDELAVHGVYGVDGSPLAGTGAIVRLHPQAAARLEQLMTSRLGPAAGSIRPVPTTIVIADASDNLTPQWFGPSMPLAPSGTVTFHDSRGLIIDPVAVAGQLADLAAALPGLADAAPVNAPGGLADVAGLGAAATIVHVVDPHGGVFRAADGVEPRIVAGAADVGPIPATGLAVLAAGQSIGIPDGAAERLRLGWYRNDVADRLALTPPDLPAGVSLHRQFLRATAVDLRWHLLGNRSANDQHGVKRDDQTIPAEFVPQVRDRVRLDLPVDGVATLGTAAEVLGPPTSGAFNGLLFAVSPVIDAAVGLPPAADGSGRWPSFPPNPGGTQPAAGTASLSGTVTARWSGERDVNLTFAAGSLPRGSHIRIYTQSFQAITAITADQPSFLRADGAALLVDDETVDQTVALVNPLALPEGSNQPAGSNLTFDAVINDRLGRRLMVANVSVPVQAAGAVAPAADQFAAPDLLAVIPPNVRSIAPSPVFGLPTGSAPSPVGDPPTLVELLRALASESTPRIAPRLPTMARFPTLVMVATDPGGGGSRTWDAVVTGGRWQRESRCAGASTGNPGGPAGADVSVAGVRVDGAAAFDVAQIAVRRAQPLLPLTAGGLGWIPFVGDPGWDAPPEPADDSPGPGQTDPRTSAVAVLRTVAVAAESPELTLPIFSIPEPDASVQNLVDAIANQLGVTPPGINIAREEEMVREIRREFHWSRFGSRDAQWALLRAVRQARDLVFVASPQFCRTAHPDGQAQDHEVDLIEELKARMDAHKSLQVLVCVPRFPDHATSHGGWIRQAFTARNEAIDELRTVDPNRVVAFHPRGFPGRSVAIRSTSVVVDDAWLLTGTSHWRRRGLTFDEGVDVVGFDRQADTGGASDRIRRFRRALLAELAGVAPGEPEFVRMSDTRSCVDVIADLVGQGGLGRLAPFWPGPTDNDVQAQTVDVADPDGGTSDDYLALFATLLAE